MTAPPNVGVWLMPQHTTTERLRDAWRRADALGVHSIWLWDHFFPLTGDPEGTHFEGWTLLAAMAADTRRARIGVLVTNQDYRNPDLLADMARTVDHLSGGRLVLALGAGWVERDYTEYGYEFRPNRARAEALEGYVRRVRARLARLNPPPLGDVPLMIGGDGKRVVLRVAAQYADAWNTMAWRFEEGMEALDAWCERLGRDPHEIERSCFITEPRHLDDIDRLVAAGARTLIVQVGDPFDFSLVDRVLERTGLAAAR